ncbi:hypothetical protein ACJX0J_011489, partial [Zea mays]
KILFSREFMIVLIYYFQINKSLVDISFYLFFPAKNIDIRTNLLLETGNILYFAAQLAQGGTFISSAHVLVNSMHKNLFTRFCLGQIFLDLSKHNVDGHKIWTQLIDFKWKIGNGKSYPVLGDLRNCAREIQTVNEYRIIPWFEILKETRRSIMFFVIPSCPAALCAKLAESLLEERDISKRRCPQLSCYGAVMFLAAFSGRLLILGA